MQLITISMLVLWFLFFGIYQVQLSKLKKEISYLPPLSLRKILPNTSHPVVGRNIADFISDNLILKNAYFVVGITSTSCPFCKVALKEFMEENKNYNLLYLNVLKTNDKEKLLEFQQIFKTPIKNIEATDRLLQELKIDSFPTFLLIAPDGVIIHATFRIHDLFSRFRNDGRR